MPPSLKKTILEGLLVGGAGFGLGTLFGTQLDKLIHPIPPDVQALLDELQFRDVQRGEYLTQRNVLSYGEEMLGDKLTKIWHIGYGPLVGYVANDIVVELQFNTVDDGVFVAITKLAWNAVEVYRNGVLLTTLEQVTAVDTVYGAFFSTWLREPIV